MIAAAGFVALAGAVALVSGVAALSTRGRRRRRLLTLARTVTARHARLLSVKQQQLVVHDGYGNYALKPWIDHVDYFIETVILREARAAALRVDKVSRGTALWADLRRVVLATVNAEKDACPSSEGAEIISGAHYETMCRNRLQARGWRVSTTPVTGDQGADLIAEADGRRVVIQCKFHGRPVGNKAVQEAAAAIAYHAGDRAAVVANSGFTRSARLLADANAVLLLHHDQLADLRRLIGEHTAGAR